LKPNTTMTLKITERSSSSMPRTASTMTACISKRRSRESFWWGSLRRVEARIPTANLFRIAKLTCFPGQEGCPATGWWAGIDRPLGATPPGQRGN
jgi:hypothetical protein